MIQGTTSDAGKSTLVAGLCRVLQRQGIKVVPFKPQNMALNSAVTDDGGEIGRAQAVQAQACKLAPHTDMNPILIKPNSDTGAQIIVHGKAIAEMDAAIYHDYKPHAMNAVLASHERLKQQYDVIIVEGAGSPAEINLRDKDIANMGFAEAVDCPVLLIADIDRGGVFAHLVGTLALLSESEQARTVGMVINRFRGDIELLNPGVDWLEKRTGKPCLGVLPYLHGLHIEAEDSLNGENIVTDTQPLRVIVPALPRMSNHTDFDPLRLHPQVDFSYVGPEQTIPAADLIIIPGSKSVQADLAWLRSHAWETAIQKHLRYGGSLLGICGGFQMLGNELLDPEGIEGKLRKSQGLGLLDMTTTLVSDKQLRNVRGQLCMAGMPAVAGYEIHAGITTGSALDRPLIKFEQGHDGAISDDDQVMGSYVHGLFGSADACASLLAWAGLSDVKRVDYDEITETAIDRLADTIEQTLDMDVIYSLIKDNP